MFCFFFFFQKAENNRFKKMPVSQNFVTFFFVLVRPVDQQIDLVLPYRTVHVNAVDDVSTGCYFVP